MSLHLPDQHDESAHRPRQGSELLWSIRTWVIWTCREFPVESRIREVLTGAGMPHAADWLFAFMEVVGRSALRPLTIACVCEDSVGPDEQRLLDVIALYQQRRSVEAMLLLRSFLPPRAAMSARDNAERLAAVLFETGHWLPAPLLPAIQYTALVFDDGDESPAPAATIN